MRIPKAKKSPAKPQQTKEVPTSFEIDIMAAVNVGEGSELAALLDQYAARVAAMSPAERAEHKARLRAEEEEADRRAHEAEAAFAAEQARLLSQHEAIEADRARGVVATQSELGRPLGLSAIAVGRVLDSHGLRTRVDVPVEGGAPGSVLHLMRGVLDGYAVHDDYNGRVYWIVANVVPLLEPHRRSRG